MKLTTQYNHLSGRVYLDQNGNGQAESGEPGFSIPVIIQETGGNFATTDGNGTYFLFADTGAFQISVANLPPHYTLTEGAIGYSGQFTAYGQMQQSLNFGLTPIPNQQDLQVYLTPKSAARPGFPVTYQVDLKNAGTTTLANGTVTLDLPANANYIGSTPSASLSGQQLTWTYTSLLPLQSRVFQAQFSMPITTALGTVLTASAHANPVAGDVVPSDNTESIRQIVTGSFDPNEKTVSHAQLSVAQVQAGQPLDYIIYFQNLGTDTAFTVNLTDSLSFQQVDPGSLQLISTSHSCIWSLTGQGVLSVRFPNIRLPHQGVNSLGSQGFARFRLTPDFTLAAGDIIPNEAHIVFDYNLPIATNTALTSISANSGLAEAAAGNGLTLYPFRPQISWWWTLPWQRAEKCS